MKNITTQKIFARETIITVEPSSIPIGSVPVKIDPFKVGLASKCSANQMRILCMNEAGQIPEISEDMLEPILGSDGKVIRFVLHL